MGKMAASAVVGVGPTRKGPRVRRQGPGPCWERAERRVGGGGKYVGEGRVTLLPAQCGVGITPH